MSDAGGLHTEGDGLRLIVPSSARRGTHSPEENTARVFSFPTLVEEKEESSTSKGEESEIFESAKK